MRPHERVEVLLRILGAAQRVTLGPPMRSRRRGDDTRFLATISYRTAQKGGSMERGTGKKSDNPYVSGLFDMSGYKTAYPPANSKTGGWGLSPLHSCQGG